MIAKTPFSILALYVMFSSISTWSLTSSPLTWSAGGMGAQYADFASDVRLHLLKNVKAIINN